MKLVLQLLAVFAALYAILLMSACAVQERFLYFPDPSRIAPQDAGLAGAREDILTAGDGVSLVVWRAEPKAPGGPIILYFHGNGSNLANRADFFGYFLEQGWGLAALSYRSYGGSQGRPSEAANMADARALYDALIAEGVAARSVIAYGESLGSGVAVQLAASREVGGLVLHAPYSAVVDVAEMRAPFLLPRAVLRDQYRSTEHIGKVRAPILWMHGDADQVIPIRFGRKLYDAAPEPKTAVTVPGAGHNGLYRRDLVERVVGPFIAQAAG